MIYTEEQGDLFEMPSDYWFAQCISADFGMGAGIAVSFNRRFNQKARMLTLYPNYESTWTSNNLVGDCLVDKDNHVFNLVTKTKCWHKPTYESITKSLVVMRDYIECSFGATAEITKLAMPLIGCGIDRLNWNKVREIIKDIFSSLPIEIVVKYL